MCILHNQSVPDCVLWRSKSRFFGCLLYTSKKNCCISISSQARAIYSKSDKQINISTLHFCRVLFSVLPGDKASYYFCLLYTSPSVGDILPEEVALVLSVEQDNGLELVEVRAFVLLQFRVSVFWFSHIANIPVIRSMGLWNFLPYRRHARRRARRVRARILWKVSVSMQRMMLLWPKAKAFRRPPRCNSTGSWITADVT